MKIDLNALTDGSRGRLEQGEWGDARETACLMSALTGETSINGCVDAGWPKWLAELGTVIFDNAPKDELLDRSIAFAKAVKAAEERGADWDRCFRDVRLRAVLPIALESIGPGDEPWRVRCREIVQWSIDHDGQAAEAAEAAKAAWAAKAAGAAGVTWAAEAAGVTWAAAAAGAAGAAKAAKAAAAAGAEWAAVAAWAAAHTRIFETTVAVLRGE